MFRDAWAATFEHVFMTRKTPRTDCPVSLPSPPGVESSVPTNSPMNDLQKGLVALAGIVSGADAVDYHSIKNEFEGVCNLKYLLIYVVFVHPRVHVQVFQKQEMASIRNSIVVFVK